MLKIKKITLKKILNRKWLLTFLIPMTMGLVFGSSPDREGLLNNKTTLLNTNLSVNSADFDIDTGGDELDGMCNNLSQSECESSEHCVWDEFSQLCIHDWNFGSSDSCFVLNEYDCEQTPGCQWFPSMNVCGDGSGWGGYNVCQDLNQMDCENTFFCDWNFDAMTCTEGYGGGFGWCFGLPPELCEAAQFCDWEPDSSFCVENYNDYDPCTGLSEEGCDEMFFCHWDDQNQVCDNGFCGYNPCQELPSDECDASFFCQWNDIWGSCEELFEHQNMNHFTDILNGYLGEYINFMDSTGYGEFHTITIENIEGGDLGDEIGLLDYGGQINFGDCSDQYGEIIVGAAVWQGEPLTITTFGAMDFCEDITNDYQQYPGWIEGNPIEIILWRADENVEYEANYNSDSGLLTWQPVDQNIPLVYHQNLDFNYDALLDVLDVIILVNHVLGTQLLSQELIDVADINGDGNVNVIDIVQLINIILNN
ncbi:MAG: hypothetical protein HQ510_03090 [Candidatus Marinimicrobia bacterium]|nr:hypothetical protein [Candidatus Neomarinimicrobiota bacterium]